MPTEKIDEVVKLCQEVIASLSVLSFNHEDKTFTHQNLNNFSRRVESSNIETFLGQLDMELVELKKMVEEYDKIESEELSVDEIERRITNLKQRVEQESRKEH